MDLPSAVTLRQMGFSATFPDLTRILEDKAENSLLDSSFTYQSCLPEAQTKSTFLTVLSADGTFIASCHSGDHCIIVTQIGSGKTLHTLKGHTRTVWALACHPTRSYLLASGCLAGEVRVWDLNTGCADSVIVDEGRCAVASLTFHPQGRLLAIANANKLCFWDWHDTKPWVETEANGTERVRYVKFNTCGTLMYTGITNVDTEATRTNRQIAPPDIIPYRCHELLNSRRQLIEMRSELSDRHRQLLSRYNDLLRRYTELQQQYPYASSEEAGGSGSSGNHGNNGGDFPSDRLFLGEETVSTYNRNEVLGLRPAYPPPPPPPGMAPQPVPPPAVPSAYEEIGGVDDGPPIVRGESAPGSSFTVSLRPMRAVSDRLGIDNGGSSRSVGSGSISPWRPAPPTPVSRTEELTPIQLEQLRDAVGYAHQLTQESMQQFLDHHQISMERLQRSYMEMSQSAQRLVRSFQKTYDDMCKLQDRIDRQLGLPTVETGQECAGALLRALTRMQQILLSNANSDTDTEYRPIFREANTLIEVFDSLLDSESQRFPPETVSDLMASRERLRTLRARIVSMPSDQVFNSHIDTLLAEEIHGFRGIIRRWKAIVMSRIRQRYGGSSSTEASDPTNAPSTSAITERETTKEPEAAPVTSSTKEANEADASMPNNASESQELIKEICAPKIVPGARSGTTKEMVERSSSSENVAGDGAGASAAVFLRGRLFVEGELGRKRKIQRTEENAEATERENDLSVEESEMSVSLDSANVGSALTEANAPKTSGGDTMEPSLSSQKNETSSSGQTETRDGTEQRSNGGFIRLTLSPTGESGGAGRSQGGSGVEAVMPAGPSCQAGVKRIGNVTVSPMKSPAVQSTLAPSTGQLTRDSVNINLSPSRMTVLDSSKRNTTSIRYQYPLASTTKTEGAPREKRRKLDFSATPAENAGCSTKIEDENSERSTDRTKNTGSSSPKAENDSAAGSKFDECESALFGVEQSAREENSTSATSSSVVASENCEGNTVGGSQPLDEAGSSAASSNEMAVQTDAVSEEGNRDQDNRSSMRNRQIDWESRRRLIEERLRRRPQMATVARTFRLRRATENVGSLIEQAEEIDNASRAEMAHVIRTSAAETLANRVEAEIGRRMGFSARRIVMNMARQRPVREAYSDGPEEPAGTSRSTGSNVEESDSDDVYSLHRSINRAIAGAFIGSGDIAIANNILDLTCRLQEWKFSVDKSLPDLKQANSNVLVERCKLHNDGSVSLSKDGEVVACFVEALSSENPVWANTELNVVSLRCYDKGTVLFRLAFGPNAISVSISPTDSHILVGLATRRYLRLRQSPDTFAQVYKMTGLDNPNEDERKLQLILNLNRVIPAVGGESLENYVEMRRCTLNCATWLPHPGQGFAYGTNRGHLYLLTPVAGSDRPSADDPESTAEVNTQNVMMYV